VSILTKRGTLRKKERSLSRKIQTIKGGGEKGGKQVNITLQNPRVVGSHFRPLVHWMDGGKSKLEKSCTDLGEKKK